MKFIIVLLIIQSLFTLVKCDSKENEKLTFYLEEIYPEGKIYRCKLINNSYIDIAINNENNLMKFINYPKDSSYKQSFSFYENGTIMSKVKLNNNYNLNGRAYYFYEFSGDLEGVFEFNNGIKVNEAVTFHDSASAFIKTISYYNEEQQVYCRKHYNRLGQIIRTEGCGE